MNKDGTIVAAFDDHATAESAVKKLANAGFAISHLSVIGKGYHTEEKVVGFYNAGDRIRFWGSRGTLWGGLWGLFFGGIFITIPVIGSVVMLGYAATAAIIAVENAIVLGSLSALGAALFSIGIPKNSVLAYEAVVKADGFLVMAHGTTAEIARAKSILGEAKPAQIDVHAGADSTTPDVIALGAA